MDTAISLLLFIGLISLFLFGSRNADTNARTAIRVWGTILSVAFLVVALTCSLAFALWGFGLAMVMIIILSRF